jgi:hypothetical protein
MRAGRKRKPGLRYPCGKLKREETEREAMATALAARQRHYGVTAKQARDERLGSSLGRLNMQELISDPQYDAGLRFADLYQAHHAILGLPVPNTSSVAGLMIAAGLIGASHSSELDDEAIARLRNRFRAATDALDQCDRDHRMARGRKPSLVLFQVVCADEDTTLWPECDLGNLRVALNTLARVFRC